MLTIEAKIEQNVALSQKYNVQYERRITATGGISPSFIYKNALSKQKYILEFPNTKPVKNPMITLDAHVPVAPHNTGVTIIPTL